MTLSPTHFSQILGPTAGCCRQLIVMKTKKRNTKQQGIDEERRREKIIVNRDTFAKYPTDRSSSWEEKREKENFNKRTFGYWCIFISCDLIQ
jgi:hypothetical protein